MFCVCVCVYICMCASEQRVCVCVFVNEQEINQIPGFCSPDYSTDDLQRHAYVYTS